MNKSKSNNRLTTKEQFKGLQRSNHVTQVEKGCHEYFNKCQEEILEKLVVQSKINADHNKHKGLQKSDADSAIDMIKEIPNGVY